MYAPADEMQSQDDVLRGHLAMEAEEQVQDHHDPLSALENEQAQDAVRLYLREPNQISFRLARGFQQRAVGIKEIQDFAS